MLNRDDCIEVKGREDYLFTLRGVLKIVSAMSSNTEGESEYTIKKLNNFMNEIFMLCATRNYGKTYLQIKKEFSSFGESQAMDWADEIFNKYIFNKDIHAIMDLTINYRD